MLTELSIKDFAIIDHLQVHFEPGFNVLTGETGAGKSILVDAVAALLGSRLEREQIRAGAEQTEIEGLFILCGPLLARLRPLLLEHGLLESDEDKPAAGEMHLIVRRDLRASGRSVCRINGRAVPIKILEEVGAYLVDIHGQGDHLLLLRPREQVGFLDRYAGLQADQQAFAESVRRLRAVRAELETLRRDERELTRRVDLLHYEVREINDARLVPGEEAELKIERDRLANAERLAALAEGLCTLLYEGDADEARPVVDLLGQAAGLMSDITRVDSSLAPQLQTLEEISYQVEDLARTLRAYRDQIEFNPRRLEQVESRLSQIYTLCRKYGDSIQEVLAYGERAAKELSLIEHAGERTADLEAEEDILLRELGHRGEMLSAARRQAGERLGAAVEEGLRDLRMERARFAVELTREECPDGIWVGAQRFRFDSLGLDRVEFLISANPGEPLRPLASVASGGETSRLMLALKNALTGADEVPTLVFDEIDSGIGGVVGSLVGAKLRQLAGSHQVLCVTHLPQLAAAGSVQFHVEKALHAGRTTTAVRRLDGSERVQEIAQMMGSITPATQQSAREMLGISAG